MLEKLLGKIGIVRNFNCPTHPTKIIRPNSGFCTRWTYNREKRWHEEAIASTNRMLNAFDSLG